MFKRRPTMRAPDLGWAPLFLGSFLASAESRFEGESTPSPQAGNAGRWVAVGKSIRKNKVVAMTTFGNKIRRLIYFLVLLTILLVLTTSRVLACSGFTLSFWDAYTAAEAVFSGNIINIGTPPMYGDVKVTFHVLKAWKGPKDEYLVVTTAGGVTACGIPFEDRLRGGTDTFLVYAYDDDGNLNTHAFSRTAPLSAAGEDIMKLNIITNPVLIVIVSVVTGLAIIGVSRYFLQKTRNRSLSENEGSEIQ